MEKEASFQAGVLDRLCREGVEFHGSDGSLVNWAVSEAALNFIFDRVLPGSNTLETGCGYSTVAFALTDSAHVCISPQSVEHNRILQWCADQMVPTAKLQFVVAASQDALPQMKLEPLDFVLIDGDHAFPIPFIDWYYSVRSLRVGGLLMVDDTQIITGTILHDFLRAEAKAGRWRLDKRFDTSAIFEKLVDDVHAGVGWRSQPYCDFTDTIRQSRAGRLRARLQLRSQLRRAWRGLFDPPSTGRRMSR